jgi:hypothetical protein
MMTDRLDALQTQVSAIEAKFHSSSAPSAPAPSGAEAIAAAAASAAPNTPEKPTRVGNTTMTGTLP